MPTNTIAQPSSLWDSIKGLAPSSVVDLASKHPNWVKPVGFGLGGAGLAAAMTGLTHTDDPNMNEEQNKERRNRSLLLSGILGGIGGAGLGTAINTNEKSNNPIIPPAVSNTVEKGVSLVGAPSSLGVLATHGANAGLKNTVGRSGLITSSEGMETALKDINKVIEEAKKKSPIPATGVGGTAPRPPAPPRLTGNGFPSGGVTTGGAMAGLHPGNVNLNISPGPTPNPSPAPAGAPSPAGPVQPPELFSPGSLRDPSVVAAIDQRVRTMLKSDNFLSRLSQNPTARAMGLNVVPHGGEEAVLQALSALKGTAEGEAALSQILGAPGSADSLNRMVRDTLARRVGATGASPLARMNRLGIASRTGAGLALPMVLQGLLSKTTGAGDQPKVN